jgi:hypothetical protein
VRYAEHQQVGIHTHCQEVVLHKGCELLVVMKTEGAIRRIAVRRDVATSPLQPLPPTRCNPPATPTCTAHPTHTLDACQRWCDARYAPARMLRRRHVHRLCPQPRPPAELVHVKRSVHCTTAPSLRITAPHALQSCCGSTMMSPQPRRWITRNSVCSHSCGRNRRSRHLQQAQYSLRLFQVRSVTGHSFWCLSTVVNKDVDLLTSAWKGKPDSIVLSGTISRCCVATCNTLHAGRHAALLQTVRADPMFFFFFLFFVVLKQDCLLRTRAKEW